MSAALSKTPKPVKKAISKQELLSVAGRRAYWNVESWTNNGRNVGFRIVRGTVQTLEVAKDGGFVVDPTVPSSDPKSRSNMRDAAIKKCEALNREINEEKIETRLAKNNEDANAPR